MTDAKEAPMVKFLDRVSCICYLVQFRKDKGRDVLALPDSGSEVNAMTPTYAAQLGLKVQKTNVGAQKIDRSSLATFSIVITIFQVFNMLGRSWFFQKTLLLANISMKVVLSMFLLTFSNVDIQFAKKELTWRTYTTKKTLLTTRWIELIDWKKFANAALDENIKAFVVHVSSLRLRMTIHLARKAQLALLLIEKVTVLAKYSDFADVFLEKSANILSEQTGVNKYGIKLEKGKQPSYGPIYSLGPVELETLNMYIETNLANGFIRASKLSMGAPIFFIHKPNGSLCWCVNYGGLNDFTIKNQYLLPLIDKFLDRLGQAKQFTQLNLISTYHQMRIKESDEWKTGFWTWYGHFEYQIMLFELFNIPASF